MSTWRTSWATGAIPLAAGAAADLAAARQALQRVIASGEALARFAAIVEAQGGNPAIVDDPSILPQAPVQQVWRAPASGVVSRIEPRRIGRAIIGLGGGRQAVTDEIDPAVGFMITARPGDRVERGEPLATIYARTDASAERAATALLDAVLIGDSADVLPLMSHRLTASGVEVR